ncbi:MULTISPECIES: RND family transporter [unclassified Oceanispirochaeta]|uniref:efflux RND transporter permease subunit n=1 Tax=unclassified Oceanispirochaeta TaxID=2635722 RepID=UPI000E09D6EB|nr:MULTISPECIES: MMPL family transporter [unclassified Oceanispirochaeta]MBF9014117.1 RND family transporter [Oceanispirochaeta sp. M2]NPD70608.1 RND family transporter [Oceanispirochaeta sp. M1]RDG34373.1 RND family transporter [Oceanispirochaeta sp. M1]
MSINSFLRFTLKHSITIIIITFLMTIFMGYHAMHVQINPDPNSLMPQKNSRILRLKETLGVQSEKTNYLFLSIEGEDLYSLEVLQTYFDTISEVSGYEEVTHALTPFNFVFFDTKGKRILPTTMVDSGKAPADEAELELFKKRISNNPLADNFVVAAEGTMLNAIFSTKYSEDSEEFMRRFEKTIGPLQKLVTVRYSGDIPIGSRITFYLIRDFSILLVLAVLAMLTLFFLSFRAKRAIILPVIVVTIGAIWSVGFMSLAGFKLTLVSVIVPSLILTIGSSYTIHVLNEYFRNARAVEEGDVGWLVDAVEHVIRTVILAALTTIISFLSLLSTSMAPLQEFGLSIGIGIFFCAVLALFFLPATFKLMGPPHEHHKLRIDRGNLTKIVTKLGTWAGRHPYISLAMFLVLLGMFVIFYPNVKNQSDYLAYFPEDDQVILDTRTIIQHTGGSQGFNITISAPEGEEGYFLRPDVLQKVNGLEEELEQKRFVNSLLSFNGILKSMNQSISGEYEIPESKGLILLLNRYFRMISSDMFSLENDSSVMNSEATTLTIYMKVSNPETYNYLNEDDLRILLSEVDILLDEHLGDGMVTDLWGNTLLLLDASKTIKRDQFISTMLSMVLGVIVTFIFFRAMTYSLMALIPLLSGIFCYFIILYLFRIPLDMTTILVTNVTVGVGLDDAVHFLLQYRTQRKEHDYQEAIHSTLRITGRPIVLTTLSLVAGLLVLCFASFSPIVFFGVLIAGTLFSTMLGTVFFLPAALTLIEKVKARMKSSSSAGVKSST